MKEIAINEGTRSSSLQISPTVMNIPITVISGVAAQATVQPMLMVKVRMQLHSESVSTKSIRTVFSEIYSKQGGISAFYRGLDAGCLRQSVFTPVRIGAYYWLSELLKSKKDIGNKKLSLTQKLFCSGITGLVGIIACSPFDVAQIRLQADRTLPPEIRRNYRNAFHAVVTTVKEEGISGLFKGMAPNLLRGSVVNVVMMISFEEAKERLRSIVGNAKLRTFLASLISGSMTAFCTLPFDNLKVKLQKQKRLPDGNLPYKGLTDCLMKSLQREGVRGLWSGLTVYMYSVATLSFLILMITEYLRNKAGLID